MSKKVTKEGEDKARERSRQELKNLMDSLDQVAKEQEAVKEKLALLDATYQRIKEAAERFNKTARRLLD